jgi:hypothetical protein
MLKTGRKQKIKCLFGKHGNQIIINAGTRKEKRTCLKCICCGDIIKNKKES